jgi:hypothetical protein
MLGSQILVRTLSKTTRTDRYGNRWQCHSRSDHHSKVACCGIVIDLLRACPALCAHIAEGRVHFGINHEMRDFVHDRKKNLDLVLCTAAPGHGGAGAENFLALIDASDVSLEPQERKAVEALPPLKRAPVGSVLLALEAKACMTARQRALPRLYGELNSSHLTVHGASDQAIAMGFAMINRADRYISPDMNKKNRATDPDWSVHNQPRDAALAVSKVRQLPRRARPGETGYDAFGVLVVDMVNDGSPVALVDAPPAAPVGDIHHYASMIERAAHIYATRFAAI